MARAPDPEAYRRTVIRRDARDVRNAANAVRTDRFDLRVRARPACSAGTRRRDVRLALTWDV